MLSLFLIFLGFSLSHVTGLPFYNGAQQSNDLLANNYGGNEIIKGRNMITVPANCPPGQQLVSGVCRDIWKNYAVTERIAMNPKNVITAPTNCPDGQELINGVCRDVWRAVMQRNAIPQNVITAPTNCPGGQELINGECRDVWRAVEAVTSRNPVIPQNVITVPTNCPEGQELINGVCRDVWRAVTESSNIKIKNVVTAPANCPAGQQLINGACRDVWRNIGVLDAEYLGNIFKNFARQQNLRNTRQVEEGAEFNLTEEDLLKMNVNKNIINVPNQCPDGYRPDANGNCREILI